MKSHSVRRLAPGGWRFELLCLEDRSTPAASTLHPFSFQVGPLGGGGGSSSPVPNALSPDQIRGGYAISSIPDFNGAAANGAGMTIAIVDAYDDPTAATDLATFDAYYGTAANGLNAQPVASFLTKVNQNGGSALPGTDPAGAGSPSGTWEGEESLDLDMVHTIAPGAKIILVETNDATTLEQGDIWALHQSNISVISNSWGGSEYPTETSEDPDFIPPASHPGVAVLFSSGDDSVVSYPASSPNVLAIGATDLYVNADNSYNSETPWFYDANAGSGSGGGLSADETIPSFQAAVKSVASVVQGTRGTPDVSMVGGSNTPVSVCDSYDNGTATPWTEEYGTSASCPQWAGLMSIIDQGRASEGLTSLSTSQIQNLVYSLPAADFHDIDDPTGGSNSYGDIAGPGYDLLTGIGSPVANKLVTSIIGTNLSATLTATPNNLPNGGTVTLTFTLTGGSITPTGTVDFTVGGRDLGTAPIVNGVAILQTAAFAKGTSTVTGTYSGDTNFPSKTATTTVTFGVTGTTLTVTGPSNSIVYGNSAPITVTVAGVVPSTPGPTGTVAFTYVNSLGATVTLGTATLSGGTATFAATPLPAGDEVITATYLGDTNYSASVPETTSVIVTPAPLEVSAKPVSFVYGGVPSLPSLTYTIGANQFQFTDTAASVLSGSLTTDALYTSGVGSYAIVQGSLVANSNYTLIFNPSTLTITAATLSVTIDSETKAYGAPLPTLAVGAVQGLVNGDTALSVLIGLPLTTASSASSVGTYPITLGTLDAGSNYTLVVNNTNPTLTITPVTLDVIANNASTVYGSAFPTNLTYTTVGLVNEDTAQTVLTGALATPVVSTNGVGKYPITQGTLALATNNYTLTFTPGTFSISRAKLTVTANSLTTENDGAIPPLTYTVTGLVNADLPGVVSGVTLSTTATQFSAPGQYPIMISGGTASNYTLTLVGGTLTVGLSTRLVGTSVTLVGSNNGTGTATLYNSAGVAVQTFTPFPGFTGSIRTAVGDFNGDGTPDLVFGTGPGILAQFVVLDGKTFQPLLFDTIPFQGFSGGLFVATGDIDGDGTDQVVVTPDQGGGPRVEIYHAGIGTPVLDFYGINDPNFRGGARAAIGDFTHDGHADLVVAAGAGGGARVVVYKGTDLSQGRVVDLVGDFFAFPNIIRNGVYVTVGDVNGDGYDDLIIGAGPGGGPNVLVLNGQTLVDQGAVAALAHPIANFFAGDTTNRDGVPVSAENLTGDGYADVVTGQGGGGSLVTVYSGKALAAGNVDILSTLDPFGGSTGGVYVG